MNSKLIDSYYLQSIFANWLDLMDIIMNVKDQKNICYKILDFCQTLNNGKFACFTTVSGDFISRGEKQEKITELHENKLVELSHHQCTNVWIDHHCIHFSLEFDFQIYGLFSVEFEEHVDSQQIAYIFSEIQKMLRKNYNNSSIKESVFDLLHTSMQEMNSHQYYLSNLSLNFVQKAFDHLQISESDKKTIINVCKVFPYRLEFLKNHIHDTKEWKLLQEFHTFIQDRNLDENRIEILILAYTYMVIIQRENKENIRFINDELKDFFSEVHDTLLKSAEHQQEEIDFNTQIEDLTDLKSVISTLALTSREKEILYLILEGLNNQEAADYLKISVHTVKNHITNIFKKLNVSDRIQAMAKIYRIKYGE